MMHGSMDSMMGWMMAGCVLGGLLVIGLAAAIVVLLVRLIRRQDRETAGHPPPA